MLWHPQLLILDVLLKITLFNTVFKNCFKQSDLCDGIRNSFETDPLNISCKRQRSHFMYWHLAFMDLCHVDPFCFLLEIIFNKNSVCALGEAWEMREGVKRMRICVSLNQLCICFIIITAVITHMKAMLRSPND